jgi:hypothetical protein
MIAIFLLHKYLMNVDAAQAVAKCMLCHCSLSSLSCTAAVILPSVSLQGFSYTDDSRDTVYDEKGVADDMLDFLWEFFKGRNQTPLLMNTHATPTTHSKDAHMQWEQTMLVQAHLLLPGAGSCDCMQLETLAEEQRD